MLKRFTSLSALLLVGSLAIADDKRPPNFIFLLSDDVAQGDLGCYGQTLIQTPRLNQMAAEGTRFMQAYCGTTVCAPSRSSFMTGLHSGHCPVRGNYELSPEGQLPLPKETVSIAEVAKQAGYATATFGKWGMGFFDTSGSPLKQGMDHFYGYNCQRHAHSYFPRYLYSDDRSFSLDGNDGKSVGKTYAQALIQNDVLGWVKKNADKPFFIYYAVTLPHGRHEIDDLGIYANKPWTDQQKSYAAQVTRLDSDVGALIDLLRELKIDTNTLIVFSGDNGSSFDPKSEMGAMFKQNSNGLRGYKRELYEGALRQAAIAWWPSHVPAGRVDEQPWAFWDLMPTFAELSDSNVPARYETDGVSLVSYLHGGEVPERDYFYWELHEGKPIRATRFGDWKAVQNGIDKPIELYDLSLDRAEANNVADQHPESIEKAKQIFVSAHREDPHWPLTHKPEARSASEKAAWNATRERLDK